MVIFCEIIKKFVDTNEKIDKNEIYIAKVFKVNLFSYFNNKKTNLGLNR